MLGIAKGAELLAYGFPAPHPLSSDRVRTYYRALDSMEENHRVNLRYVEPVLAHEKEIELFHDRDYIELVRKLSAKGTGYLDYGDTPAFKGCFEAASYVVGSTLKLLRMIKSGEIDYGFNPSGGLHHARKEAAGGFCVFNDAGVAIKFLLEEAGYTRVAYVDIDAHHGDGVCYDFYADSRLIFADIHQDGRTLYPGTGFEEERGVGESMGTKLNIPLPAGSRDPEFRESMDKVMDFVGSFKVDFVLFQCGADGLEGDPITGLRYSSASHRYAAERLRDYAHQMCGGRLLAMGGGGYNIDNVAEAWIQVTKALTS